MNANPDHREPARPDAAGLPNTSGPPAVDPLVVPGDDSLKQQATLIRNAGTTVAVLCGLALLGVAIMGFGTDLQLDAASYLAWVGTGGGAGLVVAAFADVMKTASGRDWWEVITKAGRLFAAWWALIVSFASVTPLL